HALSAVTEKVPRPASGSSALCLGLMLVFLGVVWTLQAFDIAFNKPMVPGGHVSFMVNNRQWAVYAPLRVPLAFSRLPGLTPGARRSDRLTRPPKEYFLSSRKSPGTHVHEGAT